MLGFCSFEILMFLDLFSTELREGRVFQGWYTPLQEHTEESFFCYGLCFIFSFKAY